MWDPWCRAFATQERNKERKVLEKNAKYRGSIGDYTKSPSNRGPGWPKLSAIHVTAKTICERLVLVQGWRSVAKFVLIPSAPTLPTAYPAAISRFACLFVSKIGESKM